ncbi:response regulator transcription factor [Shewanella sp. 4t3-1-2LB]|uniref:response regulator transcription factor n=1 Tax=Shewanella sp. 4t3-1-2LB TaxID=2817682 RepID=UPI001A9926BB|nr:response regulator [Shewanella sp. 4t3-1-2LB]MBO1271590.1 response regulator transcription factor [Shewanella sp. 4t3-1-2LB]
MVEDKHSVYLVDDDASVLRSLSFMLESYDFQVREFVSAEAFIAAGLWQQTGCVILDMRMPGLSGQQLHQLLRQHQSPLAVIYLTGHGDVPLAVDALKQGAVDFFQKPADGAMLAQAVTKAMQCSQANALRQQQLQTYQKLTPREREILKLIAKGYKNQQIADELFIAVRTVEIHRANLMRGMQVDSLAELMLTYAAIANTLAQSDG